MDSNLTLKQQLFCKAYIKHSGNGTRAYAEAHGLDLSDTNQYSVAAAGATENLKKPQISGEIGRLLEQEGFNDIGADSTLLKHINHKNPGVSLRAIQEYNKIRGRYKDRLEISTKGEITPEEQEKIDKLLRENAGI